MRSCQLFSLAVVALSFISMTGCASTGLSQATATGLTGENAPVTQAMAAAGIGAGAQTASYHKTAVSPIAAAMAQAAQGDYAKKAQ